MVSNKGRFSFPLRAMALILSIAFVFQDLAYADPDLLLKSSTLAPKNLATGEDKPKDLQRFALAYIEDMILREPNLNTAVAGARAMRAAAVSMNIPGSELPSVLDTSLDGFVKLSFSEGTEIVFFDPNIINVSALLTPGKKITRERVFNNHLSEMVSVPSVAKQEPSHKRPKSYQKKLEEVLKLNSKFITEITKALDVVYRPKSRVAKSLSWVRIVNDAAGALNAEVKAGLVTTASVKIALKQVVKCQSFTWLNSAQKGQAASFRRHISKALAIREKEMEMMEDMSGEAWRSYSLKDGAGEEDRDAYIVENSKDIAIRLRSIIEDLPDRQLDLRKRLVELRNKINNWRAIAIEERGAMFGACARAFRSISVQQNVGSSTSARLKYASIRCRALAGVLGYTEEMVQQEMFLGEAHPSKRGALTLNTSTMVLMSALFIACVIIFAAIAGVDKHVIAYVSIGVVAAYFIAGRLVQEKYLDYYLRNAGDILNRIKDGEVLEKEKVVKLFIDVLNAYRLFLIRDRVKKRKELIANLILVNIIPPEEMEKDKIIKDGEKRKQSHVRSDVARDLIINEIFASKDSSIFQPALEAIIELIAKYPKYYSKQFLPLLEMSHSLPRFARALVDVLVKADRDKVKLFGLQDQNRFMDEGKNIITEIANRIPEVRTEITAYLIDISEKSEKEIELVHDLLDRIGFFITPSEEFPKTAAVQVTETIRKIRADRKIAKDERKTINIVLTGGATMPEFFDYLAKLIDKETWQDIHIYQLCERKWYAPSDDRSMAYFINKHLPGFLPESNRHFINGMQPDPDYMKNLNMAGGADIMVLGIGNSGRIGFNEPSDIFDGISGELNMVRMPAGEVSTGRYYPAETGYTMALSDIVKCESILLLAEGQNKAYIIKKALFESVDPRIPASILQRSKHLKVILDIGAMDKLAPNFLTRYKRAVKSLADMEERSRDLFEDSPAPQHEINRDGIILRSNKAEARMLGYDSPEDLRGMHIWDLIHPDDIGKARERIVAKFAKRSEELPEVEARYITKDGRIIWVLIKDRQSGPNGEVETIQSTLTDITRFKDMEEELAVLKGQIKTAARISGELGGRNTGAAMPLVLGLLFIAANIIIYAFFMLNDIPRHGFVIPEADYAKLSEAFGGLIYMIGFAANIKKKDTVDSPMAKFTEELARLQTDIEIMEDSDEAIPDSEFQKINAEFASLFRRVTADFRDDPNMKEFCRGLLIDLRKRFQELVDENIDVKSVAVSLNTVNISDGNVTQESIDADEKAIDRQLVSLEDPGEDDPDSDSEEFKRQTAIIRVRIGMLREDIDEYFSDDTDMLERYVSYADDLDERLDDVLQENGIKITDEDVSAAETAVQNGQYEASPKIELPKNRKGMSISKRVEALEDAVEKLVKADIKDISEFEQKMKKLGPEIMTLYDKCSKARSKNLYARYHQRLLQISAKLKEFKGKFTVRQEVFTAKTEGLYRDFNVLTDIENNAERVISLFVNALASQAPAQKETAIVLAIDKSLGPTDEIRSLIQRYIVEALAAAGSGSEDMKRVFENLSIIDGDAASLPVRLNSIIEKNSGKEKGRISKESVLILTANSNLEYFKDFEGRSLITAVNDSDLKTEGGNSLNYYPMIELIFFSVARMVISSKEDAGAYKDSLWQWYKDIPNIDNIDRKYFENAMYESDSSILKKTIMLKLIPRTRQFGPDELKTAYEHIREFITKA